MKYLLACIYLLSNIHFHILPENAHLIHLTSTGTTQIDQQLLQELSASPNLVGDQTAHPVYDHSWSWLHVPSKPVLLVINQHFATVPPQWTAI